MDIPRSEYPRPQFLRDLWLNLNGPWQFSFDEPGFDCAVIRAINEGKWGRLAPSI